MEFINGQLSVLEALPKEYNLVFVGLSIVIAIVASFTAFGVVERINQAESKYHQLIWVFFGALSMGLGLWAMHFIGLLALILPISVAYNLTFTLISLFPAILVSSAVLWLMMQSAFNIYRLFFCSIFLVVGISNMHFLAMIALELSAKVYYAPWLYLLSVLIAFCLATLALFIQFHASKQKRNGTVGLNQIKSSILLGLAVAVMFYTNMHAAVFIPDPNKLPFDPIISPNLLVSIISVVIFLILLLAITLPFMLHYRQLSKTLARQKDQLKLADKAFQTHEALMITDQNGKIQRVNQAFTRVTGYREQEVIGKSPSILKSNHHHPEFYQDIWAQLAKKGNWSGEIWNRRKNGEVHPELLTITLLKNLKGEVTHYIAYYLDIEDRKKAEQEIQRLAFFDPLTNLPNRRMLNERLQHDLNVAARNNDYGVLLFLDLDRFKHVNDSLGHSVGDEILKETAFRLSSILRKSDVAMRLGGDEFVILISPYKLTKQHMLNEAKEVAQKILMEINNSFLVNMYELFVSPSIGITLFNGSVTDPEIILKQADTAMYRAKSAGRNTFKFYQESMQQEADQRLLLEKNLRVALDQQQLSVHYQAQLGRNGIIIGAEALVRWQHPTRGFIAPNEFIPIAEDTGLIIEIGDWIFREVCHQINYWERGEIDVPHVAVNISALQFLQVDFVQNIEKILDETAVDPCRIILEITEGVFLKNMEDSIVKMNVLKKLGIGFSIDDFGTGYSSLTYLKKLPFDQLKIDQSFIRDLNEDPNDAAIVKAIITMCEGLNLQPVAEGVETHKQLASLYNYGCSCYQGYYFSKPIPADEFGQFYLSHDASVASF